MAKGKIIYFNRADLAVDYFSGLGYTCPDTSNPCDYFMSMMSKESIELDHIDENAIGEAGVDNAEIDRQYKELIEYFVNKYHASDLHCDASKVHKDVKSIEEGADAIQVVTPWCY